MIHDQDWVGVFFFLSRAEAPMELRCIISYHTKPQTPSRSSEPVDTAKETQMDMLAEPNPAEIQFMVPRKRKRSYSL